MLDPAALDRLVPLVYTELHRLAHRHMVGERDAEPLQSTALVNEAYLRLVKSERVRWQSRTHFYAVSSLMRPVIVYTANNFMEFTPASAADNGTDSTGTPGARSVRIGVRVGF